MVLLNCSSSDEAKFELINEDNYVSGHFYLLFSGLKVKVKVKQPYLTRVTRDSN